MDIMGKSTIFMAIFTIFSNIYIYIYIMQCEAPEIAKLVYNSNNYVYGTQITIVTGAFVNQLICYIW